MQKEIIVTTSWDDGHKLDLKLAPLLKQYGIRGTFYVSPENREFRKKDLLSAEEIIRLGRDFEIGAHTMTHPRLTRISKKEAFYEIIDSKKYLEKLLGEEIRCFCYPRGDHNEKIKELVKRAGFCYSRTMKRFEFHNAKDLLLSGTALEAHRNSLLTLPIDSLKILKISRFNLLEFIRNLNWENLAKRMFDRVEKHGGVYHLWGHSWVIERGDEWEKLERVLSYIGGKINVKYWTNYDIFKAIK